VQWNLQVRIPIPKVANEKNNKVTRQLDVNETLLANEMMSFNDRHGVPLHGMITMFQP